MGARCGVGAPPTPGLGKKLSGGAGQPPLLTAASGLFLKLGLKGVSSLSPKVSDPG